MSSLVHVASGLIFTRPNASSQLTMGALAREAASTRLSEVSQARLPCTAWRRGATLRNWQHWSLPQGCAAASGPGLVTVRFKP